MDVEAYLKRINYTGPLAVSAEVLRLLQLAHLRAVPFENLSIHSGEPILLNDEALFEKIVRRHRGGFCYELNGLFATLLRSLGFEVAMLSAQVANAEGVFGPDFAHMTLVVTLAERWLVDVGFGDSFLEPLLLDTNSEQMQGDRSYRVVREGERLVLSQRSNGDDWKPQYRFTLKAYHYPDYSEMCHYHQTSQQSHFTQARICSRATPDGRISLSDLRFIETAGGRKQERLISEEECATMLREQFGIVLRENPEA
ncbi:MAG: N-hydroxyarylamine O-acetyltransferase [Blastocatellia bacterium]|jgi:N-hydroxyarylamine O-acetyltransferase|nr:N-hydroxyarylamine O-acetyltransferase [Blastocatellia bacterium]